MKADDKGKPFEGKEQKHEEAFLNSDRPRIKGMVARLKEHGFK